MSQPLSPQTTADPTSATAPDAAGPARPEGTGHTRHAGRRRALLLACLLLPPLFWAGNFITGRAVRDDLPGVVLAWGRWVIAFLCLLPFAWRRMIADLPIYRAHPWRFLGTCVTGVVLFNTLIYVGLQSTQAANGMLLNSTIPVLILILGAAFYGQRLRAGQVAGLVLSLAGVAVVILHGQMARLIALELAPGDLLIFLAMVAWAFYTMWIKDFPPQASRVALLCSHSALTILVLAPFALVSGLRAPQLTLDGDTVLALLYVGIVPSIGALLLYGQAVAMAGPQVTSLFIHLLPVYGAILSVMFLGERLHGYHAAGFALILGGIALASLRRRRG